MLPFSKYHEKEHNQYFRRLQQEMRPREGDPEYTSLAKPELVVFDRAQKVAKAMCDIARSTPISATIAVTPEGYIEFAFLGYKTLTGRAWVRVETDGIRLFNSHENKEHFFAGTLSEEHLIAAFKKNMKQYIN